MFEEDDDAWPDEPDEPDPEADLPDPERELAPGSASAPVVDADVDPETAKAFWSCVVLANVGLLLVSLGPMLAFFRGMVRVGAVLTVVGVLAFVRTYYRYRSYVESRRADDDELEAEGTAAPSAEDNSAPPAEDNA